MVYHLKSSDRLKQEIKYDRIISFIRILYTVDWSIDKACEWLRDNTMTELNLDFGNFQLVREFVDHFKEAMEE